MRYVYPRFSFLLLICSLNTIFPFSAKGQNSSSVSQAEEYHRKAQWFTYEPQFNQDSVQFYYEKAITLLETQVPEESLLLAQVYFDCSDSDLRCPQKSKRLEKALDYANKTNDKLLKYKILISIVMTGSAPVSYEKNFENLEKLKTATKLLENDPDPAVQAELALGLARHYSYEVTSFDFCMRILPKSVDYFSKKIDKITAHSLFLAYEIAFNIQYSQAHFDKAIYYLNQIKDILPFLNVYDHIKYEGDCASLYETTNNEIAFEQHAQNAYSLIKKYNLQYSKQGQVGIEAFAGVYFKKKAYNEAINYYNICLQISDTIGTDVLNREILYLLAEAYEMNGDSANTISTLKKINRFLMDNLNASIRPEYKEIEVKYDVQNKDKEITEQRNQRNILILAICFFIFLSVLSVYFFRRERRNKAIIEKQSKSLQQLDIAKTRFFANVSHELRTPLTLMLGPLSTMIKSGNLDNKNFTLASLVRQNAQGLLKLVNEILDLNKLEAGKLELNPQKTVLYNLIRRIIAGFESTAETNNIDFTFDYKPDKYLQVWLDNNKFEKVLNNLLSNAFKFTKSQGKIRVVVEELPNRFKITVSDTGRGVHPEDLPNIFTRFYQSNQADALTEGGTGIGLSLSMELVKLMDGQLSAESTLGVGSTFIFEFPKKEIMGTIPTQEAEAMLEEIDVMEDVDLLKINNTETHKSNKGRILIVEDNQSLREYLSLILSPNYSILKAENGQKALDILSKNDKPDLILSDVMMPIMDGFQLLSALKSNDEYCSIPVVMLTARAELQDKLKALRIGVDDYLLKPFEEEELFARLENLISNARLRQTFIDEPIHDNSIESSLNTEGGATLTSSISSVDMAWLAQLETNVKEKLKDINYTVEQMASDMALSRTQLFRKTKQLTGLSPQQYLQEVRLQQALYLLETRQVETVKTACYEVGLLQVKNFSQLFQKRFGKLPSSYL